MTSEKILTEVAIVGGGIIGLSIAYELCRRDIPLAVIEKQAVMRGASSKSAGIIAPILELKEDEKLYNLAEISMKLYPKWVQSIESANDFPIYLNSKGLLQLPQSKAEEEQLEKLAEIAESRGLKTEWLQGDELRKREPELSENISKALYSEAYSIDPWVLGKGLRRAVQACGRCKFIEGEIIKEVSYQNDEIHLQTESKTITAKKVVLAAGAWSGKVAQLFGFQLPIKPIKGQILLFTAQQIKINHILDGPCYAVPRRSLEQDVIAVGATSEDVGFDESVTPEGVEQILEKVRSFIPNFKGLRPVQTWAGLRPKFTRGKLPIIGRFPQRPNLWIATAHYRSGIILAPATGYLVAKSIQNETELEELHPFSPAHHLSTSE